MDFQHDNQTPNVYTYDEFEYEDDVFYSELRKQVLLLTTEDDDDDDYHDQQLLYGNRNLNMAAGRKEALSHRGGGYYSWPQKEEVVAAPAWIMNLWKTGNGTGVFIPQIVTNKKKNKPRRKRNGRGRTHRSV